MSYFLLIIDNKEWLIVDCVFFLMHFNIMNPRFKSFGTMHLEFGVYCMYSNVCNEVHMYSYHLYIRHHYSEENI